ncbi:MAG: hypothetical protein LBT10_00550 [Methanobrevibacter sp.]|jgi:hypothetical protein|nr:hypothetical protein [Methanobrevibacter sp.]
MLKSKFQIVNFHPLFTVPFLQCQNYGDITVKHSGDASNYVKAEFKGKNNMQYTGLKATPAGKTVDLQVGKSILGIFYYKVVHVTVIP